MKDSPNKEEIVSLCPHCNCATHTIDGKCGKCKKMKDSEKIPKGKYCGKCENMAFEVLLRSIEPICKVYNGIRLKRKIADKESIGILKCPACLKRGKNER